MYPHLAPLSGAREIRVPLADGYVHDLDAIADRDHRGDPARPGLQPEQPDRHAPAGGADRRVPGPGPRPRHGDPRRGLRRVPARSRTPRRRSTCWRRFPNLVCCGRSASATGSPACGSATRWARRASAPRSTPSASRSASTRSPRRRPPRRSCTRTTSSSASSARSSSGSWSRRASRELGLETAETQANFSWISLGDRDEAEVVDGPGRAGVVVRAGTPLGGPGHIRVTYGTGGERAASRRAVVPRVARGWRRRSATGWVGGRCRGERTFSTRQCRNVPARSQASSRSTISNDAGADRQLRPETGAHDHLAWARDSARDAVPDTRRRAAGSGTRQTRRERARRRVLPAGLTQRPDTMLARARRRRDSTASCGDPRTVLQTTGR